MMKLISFLKSGLATTANILVYAVTRGRYVRLEGRVHNGLFRNWGGRYRYRPTSFAQPTTEQEIVELIRRPGRVRVFGSAHSFNSGVVTDGTLISLDKYSGILWKDREKKQMAVKAGTRVRDVVRALFDEGWAFAALPSHDAQSIAGILSTDVHGTGKEWGFVSQSVVSLKLIDGKGEIHECGPSDPLFKAAIGGVGAVGIISEVVVQAVDRFNVAQKVEIVDLEFVEEHLEELLRKNDHLSLYLFPFTNKCQLNTWNRTSQKRSRFGSLREFLAISRDALIAAWWGNLAAYTGLLPTVSRFIHRIQKGTSLVLESNEAFNRSIYHVHQELEFSIPFEETFEACRRFIRLYEKLYPSKLPNALFEVRFTPPGHDRTLLGPGQGQRCTWIDLVVNDSDGFEAYYAAAEESVRAIGGRPHLGKFCESWSGHDFERMYGPQFSLFQQLVAEHDPEGKFSNQFTHQLFERETAP